MSATRLFRARAILAVLAVAGLAACTPQGYAKAPALGDYFAKLTPGAYAAGVDVVAECREGGNRYSSVLFKNGNLYHYRLDPEKSEFKLDFMDTTKQRDRGKELGWTVTLGCIGTYEGAFAGTYIRQGKYRLIPREHDVVAQVDSDIVINHDFDDEVKSVMQLVAKTVDDAIKKDKYFVPTQATWGAKP